MAGKRIPQETVTVMRGMVMNGMPRYRVAEKLGLGETAVKNYTEDLPKRKWRKITREDMKEIKRKRAEGADEDCDKHSDK